MISRGLWAADVTLLCLGGPVPVPKKAFLQKMGFLVLKKVFIPPPIFFKRFKNVMRYGGTLQGAQELLKKWQKWL